MWKQGSRDEDSICSKKTTFICVIKGKSLFGYRHTFYRTFLSAQRGNTQQHTTAAAHTGTRTCKRTAPTWSWISQAKSSSLMLAPAQKETDQQFSFTSAELPGLLSVILDCNCLEEIPHSVLPLRHILGITHFRNFPVFQATLTQ